MARTKQTARKSTGGKAPRKQLATKSARQFRSFMTSQQAAGNSAAARSAASAPGGGGQRAGRASFINYENTFGQFPMPAPANNETPFAPHLSAGVDAAGAAFLGVSFSSKFDGAGIQTHSAEIPALDVAVVMDISGSMGWSFSNDGAGGWGGGGETKLDVAKRAMLAIAAKLRPKDSLAVVLFNHDQHVLQPLTPAAQLNMPDFQRKVGALRPCGGTRLAEGLKSGYGVLGSSGEGGDSSSGRLRRVVFLTDMDSSSTDEEQVLAAIKAAATSASCVPIHTSVIGIGVDLSVGSVGHISSQPGCRYGSVASAAEFEASVAADFLHDVLPVAFGIKLEILGPAGRRVSQKPVLPIEKSFGSAELNETLKLGDKSCTISSEFPSSGGADNLLVLKPLGLSPAAGSQVGLRVTFTTLEGLEHTQELTATFQALSDATSDVPMRVLRKALALVRYVDLQSDYCLEDELLNASVEHKRQHHTQWLARFQELRAHLLAEMAVAGDDSLQTTNQATLGTIDQILSFEQAALAALAPEEATPPSPAGRRQSARRRANAADNAADAPHSFLCPILKNVMADPVMAADGHSYERAAIEQWFAGGGVLSPQTGAALDSLALTPNHSLRQAIDDFSSPARSTRGRATTPAATAPAIRKKPQPRAAIARRRASTRSR